MQNFSSDKAVQRSFSALLSGERLKLRETDRAVTPFGGLAVFVEYLNRIDLIGVLRQHMPVRYSSRNQIDPSTTLICFLVSVLAGARRFAHAAWLRGDKALHAMLGIDRFPTDDTIRNLFRRFSMGNVQRLFEPLKRWEMERLPLRPEGYSLDLDSTVFERYGEQEGSLKGHNPRKHGRPSHHPLLAVLAEAHLVLHGWLRSGNCGTSRGAVEFLEEALALWLQRQKIRLVRADSGFFDDKLLTFLEQRCLPYIVVTRLTPWVKREAQQVQQWTAVDEDYAVGEFQLRLHNWKATRRFVVVRERVREKRDSVGRKLIDVPGYTFPHLRHQFDRRTDGHLAGLQPAGRHGKSHRRTQERSRSRWLLSEAILCYRGGIPKHSFALQSTGRVSTSHRSVHLSAADFAAHPSTDLRCNSRPRRPRI